MAEWSIAAVLKTVELRGSGGSNPSLSAISGVNQAFARFTPFFTPKNVSLGVLAILKTMHNTKYGIVNNANGRIASLCFGQTKNDCHPSVGLFIGLTLMS